MFDQFNLHKRLLKALSKQSFKQPTEVQIRAIPEAMKGLDLFVTAPTGTGKTIAFLLPLIHNLLAKGQPGKGLQAVIILPTRELATQINKELQSICSYTFFKTCLITGGEELKQQAAKLRKNPDIVVGTPGRLVEHWKNQQLILDQLQVLILDETDRTLDMGFGDDVKVILNNCPSNKQTLLFSATLGNKILQQLAKDLLKNPVEIHLNTENRAKSNITQQAILADHTFHKIKLIKWLLANETYQQVIIFTNTRVQADQLSSELATSPIKHAVLHSDKTTVERKQTLIRLSQHHINLLIATDVAARGLDIPNIDLIINFDLPNSVEEYIHRIGRTGRMNNTGLAISLITNNDWPKLLKIEKNLKQLLTKRTIKGLKGQFQGGDMPKTSKQPPKTTNHKINTTTKTTAKKRRPTKKPSSLVSADGFAPLKRKKD